MESIEQALESIDNTLIDIVKAISDVAYELEKMNKYREDKINEAKEEPMKELYKKYKDRIHTRGNDFFACGFDCEICRYMATYEDFKKANTK
jgi:L-lysine 2,3-aminomutase